VFARGLLSEASCMARQGMRAGQAGRLTLLAAGDHVQRRAREAQDRVCDLKRQEMSVAGRVFGMMATMATMQHGHDIETIALCTACPCILEVMQADR